jgi:hypothetical protein
MRSPFLILTEGSGVQQGPLGTSAAVWPTVPAPGDAECRGMKIGCGNLSTRRKPTPEPLCPPKIPLDQIVARTWPASVESQRLTA